MAPSIDPTVLDEFRAAQRGPVLGPSDAGYDEARKVWNGMIDKRPALIARCTGVADVTGALNFAHANLLNVAVRGGGHNVAGKSASDDGFLIDLSLMRGIRVDPVARTARAQGGVTWGELDREAQLFGLATPGGTVSTTGIAGLTLGGGLGWLRGSYGLACDNLLSADVVLADGRHVTASAAENDDLFWALRGGSGNFGVVTSFEYALHPVGPMVIGGLVLHPGSRSRDLLRFYRDFTASAPDELSTAALILHAPPLPFIPAELHGALICGIGACYSGSLEDGEKAVRTLHSFGPPLVDLIGPMPYTAIQTLFDAGLPAGVLSYWKSHMLNGLADDAIEAVTGHCGESLPSPESVVMIEHMHGAVNRVAPDATAFPHRAASHTLGMFSVWTDPAQTETNVAWARDLSAATERFSTGGVYVNYLSEGEDGRARDAYGPNYDRLAAVKKKYDPSNFFSGNMNIKPA